LAFPQRSFNLRGRLVDVCGCDQHDDRFYAATHLNAALAEGTSGDANAVRIVAALGLTTMPMRVPRRGRYRRNHLRIN
jgi:hypothetical protein